MGKSLITSVTAIATWWASKPKSHRRLQPLAPSRPSAYSYLVYSLTPPLTALPPAFQTSPTLSGTW